MTNHAIPDSGPESKREAVLRAAGELFYAGGFHATGIDCITAAAGVTPRTLYRHFPSKNDLVLAVLQQREHRYLAAFDACAQDRLALHGNPVLAAFEALEDWLCSTAAGGCMLLQALAEMGQSEPRVRQLVIGHKRRVLENLEQRLTALLGQQDDTRAAGLLLLMEGATALAPVLGPETASARAIDAARILLNPGKEV